MAPLIPGKLHLVPQTALRHKPGSELISGLLFFRFVLLKLKITQQLETSAITNHI